MFADRSLAFKLVILTLASTGLIFVFVLAHNYYSTRQVMLKDLEQNARNLGNATGFKIETHLIGIEKIPRTLAALLEVHSFSEAELVDIVKKTVDDNPELFGVSISFAPYAFDRQRLYMAPYAFRGKDEIKVSFLGASDYNYFNMDWFQIPQELAQDAWSEPYLDEGGGGILMATFSAPFFGVENGRRTFKGVVTADVSLSWLKDIVSSIQIYSSGYAFLVSRTGLFVTHKKQPFIMRESIFSIAEERNDPALRQIGRRMIHGESGLVKVKDFISSEDSWMYFTPIESCGASIAIMIPEAELFAQLRNLTLRLFLIGLAGFVCLCGAILLISGSITRPLRLLSLKALELAKGNLDVELPELRGSDEIGLLNRSFRDMRIALKEYITNLAETTKAKERIESELKIARHIQMSFLPKHFPQMSEAGAIDLFAALEPAKEVGGDLYDFFRIGEDQVFFTIGDVSGKGVPAALFMAVSKTLLKGTSEFGVLPSEILRKVNHELCQENDASMFVTVFCAILNVKTGELQYANGGHNPPLILRAGHSVEWLNVGPGVVLGAFETAEYETRRMILQPGDGILLYTDGVTEAQNTEAAFYGDERLRDFVAQNGNLGSQELVTAIFSDVHQFAQGAPPADDMAILSVRVK